MSRPLNREWTESDSSFDLSIDACVVCCKNCRDGVGAVLILTVVSYRLLLVVSELKSLLSGVEEWG